MGSKTGAYQRRQMVTFNFVPYAGVLMVHKHGKSHSIRPITLKTPTWLNLDESQVEDLVVKYSKEGMTPSQIGMKLRDQHSIPLVKQVTGKKISQILKEKDVVMDLPEDLDSLVRKAVGLQRHLRANRGDRMNIRSLELVEARVHRLSVYYKKTNQIPQNWKYKSVVAQLE